MIRILLPIIIATSATVAAEQLPARIPPADRLQLTAADIPGFLRLSGERAVRGRDTVLIPFDRIVYVEDRLQPRGTGTERVVVIAVDLGERMELRFDQSTATSPDGALLALAEVARQRLGR